MANLLMTDEKDLLVSLRSGSEEAFRELFEMYSHRMFRLAAGILGSDQEAEDVVQDAFLRFFQRLDTFRGYSRVGTWLYRVVHNLSIDRLRRRRPTVDWDDTAAGEGAPLRMPALFADWSRAPESLLERSETKVQLVKAVAALPVVLRSVFVLRDMEGLSTSQTAEILGISAGAVKVRLHRARLFLRERLAAYFAGIV